MIKEFMYSYGENFYFEIDGEEYELQVVENITLKDKEYLIAEDIEEELYVFYYNEDEEEIEILEESDAMDIIEYWRSEYLSGDDIGDFEDDEYYDREDREYDDEYDYQEYYDEDEDYY